MDLGSNLDASWRAHPSASTSYTSGNTGHSQSTGVEKNDLIWDVRGQNNISNISGTGTGMGFDTTPNEVYNLVNDIGGGEGGKGKQPMRGTDGDDPTPADKEGEGQGQGPLSVHVLARVMDSSKGRDKVLKCAQYSLRTYLYLLTLVSRLRPLSPWFRSNSKRVKLAISSLSLTRKCLLLLGPLHPLTPLLSHQPMSARTLVSHLIDLLSALSDDVYCLSKLGLVHRRMGAVADRWANRFWLLTTVMSLYRLHATTLPRLRASTTLASSTSSSSSSSSSSRNTTWVAQTKLTEAEWTNRKLVADLLFVSYDVLELDIPFYEEPMKCLTGLISGLISASKLYDQQWEASVGKG